MQQNFYFSISFTGAALWTEIEQSLKNLSHMPPSANSIRIASSRVMNRFVFS